MRRDPLGTARTLQTMQKRGEDGVRRTTYLAIAGAYYLAQRLGKDEKLRTWFAKLPFWDGHSRLSPNHALAHAFMFVAGHHQGPVAARARNQARALQRHFEAGTRASKIPTLLEKCGGFAGLAQIGRVPATRSATKTPSTKPDIPVIRRRPTRDELDVLEWNGQRFVCMLLVTDDATGKRTAQLVR